MHALGVLGGLPTEILLDVFKHLHGRVLVRCQMVCKTMKDHIDQSSVTRYAIRLAKYGYKDGPHFEDGLFSSTASRLKALEDHISRWKSLDWVEERINIPHRHLIWEELVGGIFGFSSGKTITCIELPSRIRQSPTRTWTHEDNFYIRTFTMDPTQDLLALVEIKTEPDGSNDLYVHLRTLSSYTQHPRARTSRVIRSACCPASPINNFFRLKIMGDAIALYDIDMQNLMIWNWWTGKLICVEELQYDVKSFLWIGPRTILLYEYRDVVYDALVLFEIDEDTGLRQIAILELPTSYGSPRMEFTLYDPAPLNQTPSGPVPFDSSDLRNIHLRVNVLDTVLEAGGTPELVIPITMIKGYMHEYMYRDDLGSTPLIPWAQWGPPNTRLIYGHGAESWLCEVHGSRYVCVDAWPSLSVFDFTPNLVPAWPDLSQSPLSIRESVYQTKFGNCSEPTTEHHDNPFHHKGTSLSYHEAKRKLEPPLPQPHGVVYVDDEHILLFAKDDEVQGTMLIILTL